MEGGGGGRGRREGEEGGGRGRREGHGGRGWRRVKLSAQQKDRVQNKMTFIMPILAIS